MNLLSLALRNVLRNWHRTLVTTLAMAFAGVIMILFAALMEGLMQASERNAVAMNLGDIQIHAPGYRDDPDLYTRIEHPAALLERLRAAGFRASARLYGFGLAASGSTSAGVQLRGIDPRAEAGVTQVHRHLLQGQWLDSADRDGVVLGRKLARTLGVSTGDEVVIVSQASDGSIADALFRVRGVLKSVGEGVDRAGFYLLDTAFRELMVVPRGAHEIAVLRADRDAEELHGKIGHLVRLVEDHEGLTSALPRRHEHFTGPELELVDLAGDLVTAARAGDERLYYRIDIHWTPAGHRAAACQPGGPPVPAWTESSQAVAGSH